MSRSAKRHRMSKLYTNSRPEVVASDALTLPQSYYTDPAWFRREMEAIHFDMCLCAGRAGQIPKPCDYFLRKIATANVIILPDKPGEVSASSNIVRPRGTLP